MKQVIIILRALLTQFKRNIARKDRAKCNTRYDDGDDL